MQLSLTLHSLHIGTTEAIIWMSACVRVEDSLNKLDPNSKQIFHYSSIGWGDRHLFTTAVLMSKIVGLMICLIYCFLSPFALFPTSPTKLLRWKTINNFKFFLKTEMAHWYTIVSFCSQKVPKCQAIKFEQL